MRPEAGHALGPEFSLSLSVYVCVGGGRDII